MKTIFPKWPALALAAAFALSPASAQVNFQGIGLGPAGEFPFSAVRALSGDGLTVVGSTGDSLTDGVVAFRWTAAGGMEILPNMVPDDPYPYTEALGVSYDGSVVVGSGYGPDEGQVQGFRWTQATGTQPIPYPLPTDGYGEANGVSWDGNAASGFSYEPYVWTSTGGSQVLTDVSEFGFAWGISGDGLVVVGGDGSQAFRWTAAGGPQYITIPGSTGGDEAYGASYDGSTVVGRYFDDTGYTRAFADTPDGLVLLDSLGGSSEAEAVSADGLWAVGESNNAAVLWNTRTGEVWDLNLLLPSLGIDLTGWTLDCACGISADGLTIAGQGTDPDGNYQGWIATIPEPSTVLLCGLGCTLALWRFRKRG